MNFSEQFRELKSRFSDLDASMIDGHLAVQVRLTDPFCGGIFYMEVRDRILYMEPYDYVDRDAELVLTSADYKKIFSGRLGFEKAEREGRLTVNGNPEKIEQLKLLIPKIRRRVRASEKAALSNNEKRRPGRPRKSK